MKNIFIDCGTHLCEGLNHFSKLYNMDETWEIHTFEPNPNLHATVKSNIENNFPGWNIIFHPIAVSSLSGSRKVVLGMQPTEDPERPTGGGTSIVRGNEFKEGELEGYTAVTVPAIPLVDVIKGVAVRAYASDPTICSIQGNSMNLYRDKCNIVLKLDIEGAEYNALADLVKTGIGSWLNHLHVEFHHRRFKSEDTLRESEVQLIGKLFQMGVTCHPHW